MHSARGAPGMAVRPTRFGENFGNRLDQRRIVRTGPAGPGQYGNLLKENGADIINVSTGQVASHEEPVYGRMYQAPFADRIRNELGITTVVAGNINSADQVNTLVAAGRSDLVALARPIMNEPQFVLNAAAHYGHRKQYWPAQYEAGKFAAELNAARENLEQGELRNNAKPPNPQEMLAIAIARGEVLLD